MDGMVSGDDGCKWNVNGEKHVERAAEEQENNDWHVEMVMTIPTSMMEWTKALRGVSMVQEGLGNAQLAKT